MLGKQAHSCRAQYYLCSRNGSNSVMRTSHTQLNMWQKATPLTLLYLSGSFHKVNIVPVFFNSRTVSCLASFWNWSPFWLYTQCTLLRRTSSAFLLGGCHLTLQQLSWSSISSHGIFPEARGSLTPLFKETVILSLRGCLLLFYFSQPYLVHLCSTLDGTKLVFLC